MFKTKNSKLIGASLIIILVIGAVIGGIFLSNQNITNEQRAEINEYEPKFKEIVDDEFGVEPSEIKFNYNGKKKELKSVDLYFSKSDKEKHAFLNSSVFKLDKPEGGNKEYFSAKISLNEKFPKNVKLDDIFKLKLHELITKIYFALLKEKNLVSESVKDTATSEGIVDKKEKKRLTNIAESVFYHDIDQSRAKKLIKNYDELSSLEGLELFPELINLGIFIEPAGSVAFSYSEEKKIVDKLLSQPYLYIRTLRVYDHDEKMGSFTIGKTNVYVPNKKISDLKEYKILSVGVNQDPKFAADSNKILKTGKLFKILKVDENTYTADLYPEPTVGRGTIEVQIKTKL